VDLAGFAINRNAEPTGSVRRGKYLGQLGLVAGIGKSAGEELLQFDRELVERNLWFGKAPLGNSSRNSVRLSARA